MTSSSLLAQPPWFGVFIKADPCLSPPTCGANCYTDTTAMSAGCAVTATGKKLTLTKGVWVQSDGTNVLHVDGSDNWHYALNPNGKGSSMALLNKTTANLGGRVCPSSVYVDDTNKVATGRCLYYDQGNAAQPLDAPNNDGVTDQTTDGSIRIGGRAAATGKWYEGNIQTCATKGMRLPTLYETASSDPGGTYKPTDASPTFNAANGVPPASQAAWTWTSSAYTSAYYYYWNSSASISGGSVYNATSAVAVRCVLQ